jgi:ParB family chromosome partitioning protein
MAAKSKLVLAQPTTIALDKLVLSDANVRQTNASISIETLAESIARRGLLQSLSVRPIVDGEGKETGAYGVQAGGRRWRALKLLVKQKRLAKDAPIACIVKTGGTAEDDSLAENTEREALHPLDEFRAFAALRDKGWSDDGIAAARGVTPAVVRQRLRLASASPKLLDAYAADRLDLGQLMAFCVSEDHARQDQVLDMIVQQQIGGDAYDIRRLMTETCVDADDRRARFVGIEAYEAAGGTILRDLFEQESEGWLQDPELLMRLVSEKLATAGERVRAQGWKWVEAALEIPHTLRLNLRRLQPIGDALTDQEHKRYEALTQEHDALIEGLPEDESEEEDHIPQDVRARLDAIEAEIAELDSRPPKFAPEDIARAGVLVSVNRDGELKVEYGFLHHDDQARPDDETEHTDRRGTTADAVDAGGQFDTADEADAEPAGKTLPDKLVQDLTAYRTVGLRNALAQDVDTAFLALLHALCLEIFYRYHANSCLQVNVKSYLPGNVTGLGDLPAAKAIEERHEQWAAKLPEDPGELWDALVDLRHQAAWGPLFAHCVSLTVNAVREPHQPRREALGHADCLAATVSLDMASAGWSTTAENYLGRVTKVQIADAVREAKGESTARLIEHLKKGDMAKEAQRLLDGTGWLPALLRTPDIAACAMASENGEPGTAPLPAFLTEGIGALGEAERAAAE